MSKEIKDKRVISLIYRFLVLKIITQWKVIKNAAGLLQGNNFSSMSADILLNESYQLLMQMTA